MDFVTRSEDLQRFPKMGRITPELDDPNIRELLIYSMLEDKYRIDKASAKCSYNLQELLYFHGNSITDNENLTAEQWSNQLMIPAPPRLYVYRHSIEKQQKPRLFQ